MKASNIALSVLIMVLLTSMVWVNKSLEKVYSEIDLTDKLRSYTVLETDSFKVLKVSGSNGYPIDIKQGESEDIRVLRSRVSHFELRISGDTLIIHFSGARVSPSALPNTSTPPGLIITTKNLSELIMTNTHNRISGLEQATLSLTLAGDAYIELSNNRLGKLTLSATDRSSFEFRNENSADSALISLKRKSVGFLDGLSYHSLQPVMEDSAQIVLSKNALNELVKK